MSGLKLAEKDADRTFCYEQVGTPIQSCSNNPPKVIVSKEKKHWIEIALIDEKGSPVVGQHYKIRLPSGQELTGALDSRGSARVEGIDPGTCKVSFPDLDRRAWNRYR